MTEPVTLEQFLASRRALVDSALMASLPSAPRCPERLAEAMRYSIAAGGKRLRPILSLAAAEAIEPDTGRAHALAMPSAVALEFIHTYSLVHDDLPAMDNDNLRRGLPTSHVVFGDALAILAGDALLTEAFAVLARDPVTTDGVIGTRKLRVLAMVAEAAGAPGMVGGQVLDLAAEGRLDHLNDARAGAPPADVHAAASAAPPPLERAHDDLRRIHASKTGALIRAAALAGATMVGATDDRLAAIAEYAAKLGLAFQIIDDVLDVEGEAATLGKTVGKDRAAGKLTYPALFGVDGSRLLAERAIAEAVEALARRRIGGWLPALAHFVVQRAS